MNPLLLIALLATLVVLPLVLIALFFVIGKVFSAPKRFATVLFVILFLIAIGATAYGYLRAGAVSTASVTGVSERIQVDDGLRASHEFRLTVTLPDLGSRSVSVPARIYDQTSVGDEIEIRAGTVLGLKLARAEDERITDLVPLGSLICAVLVVLFTALAAASRGARAPAILLMLSCMLGIGVQPALEGLNTRGHTLPATATSTGVTSVGAAGAPSRQATAFLRGPFSIDSRWMWMNSERLRYVAVTLAPAGRQPPITAVDVVPAGSVVAVGQTVEVRYRTSDPRRITLPRSRAAQCAWILLDVLAVTEIVVLLGGLLVWRAVARRRRRKANAQIDLDRDVNRAIEFSTRREGQPIDAAETRPQPPVSGQTPPRYQQVPDREPVHDTQPVSYEPPPDGSAQSPPRSQPSS